MVIAVGEPASVNIAIPINEAYATAASVIPLKAKRHKYRFHYIIVLGSYKVVG